VQKASLKKKINYANGKEATDHPTLDQVPPDTSITSSNITDAKKARIKVYDPDKILSIV
jgi:hypothetical protein